MTAFVTFGGVHEGYGWDRRLQQLGLDGLCFKDSRVRWYLDGPDDFTEAQMLDEIAAFTAGRHAVFVGQSAGAYAALRYADRFGADVMAFAPQTYCLKGMGNAPPADLVDIRHDLISTPRKARIDIYVSRSERENPPSEFLWNDCLHIAGLERGQNIRIHTVAYDRHPCAFHLARTGELDGLLLSHARELIAA